MVWWTCSESLDSPSLIYFVGHCLDSGFALIHVFMWMCFFRWQTSQVSRCWPKAAGGWAAKGVPAAGSLFNLFLRPASHHFSHVQPRSARIALCQQETAQQQGQFRGASFLIFSRFWGLPWQVAVAIRTQHWNAGQVAFWLSIQHF